MNSQSDQSTSKQVDEFYVGYLPLPAGHRRLLRFLLPALLWACVAVAALALKGSRPAGDGEWDTTALQSWSGVLRFAPYPVLHREVDGQLEEWLLVEMGKVAANRRAEAFAGQAVTIQGYSLQRGGRQMIELTDGDSAITANLVATNAIAQPEAISRGSVELVGEILDSKCYLGAMLPGEGLTHQACARLCIDGGIPPMFIVRSASNEVSYYLLEGPTGEVANALVRRDVGVPVRVRGEWLQRGNRSILRLAAREAIERL